MRDCGWWGWAVTKTVPIVGTPEWVRHQRAACVENAVDLTVRRVAEKLVREEYVWVQQCPPASPCVDVVPPATVPAVFAALKDRGFVTDGFCVSLPPQENRAVIATATADGGAA